MAQPQANVNVSAPGFRGINTHDSPSQLSPEWAKVARNCIVDEFGRIGARKGLATQTADNSAFFGSNVRMIHEFLACDSSCTIFSAVGNGIYEGTTTMTDITPAGATITADDWTAASLGDKAFFFQRDHDPLVYDHATGNLTLVSDHADYAGSVPKGHVVRSAYGRLWVADITDNKATVYWSDLQIGPAWTGGSSGSIDVGEFWPNGKDEIVDIIVHNNFLIIFGKESILLYSGADNDPGTNLTLEDTISGLGAVQKDTAKVVGNDLWFVDVTGVRSLGRTIQEKSVPIGDVSRNVRRDIKTRIANEDDKLAVEYFSEEGFYIVHFVTSNLSYVFDSREILEDGSAKTTEWELPPTYAMEATRAGDLLFGGPEGIAKYDTYQDHGANYEMDYYTHYLDFGASIQVKFPKRIEITVLGGAGQTMTVYWGYDYKDTYKSKQFTIASRGLFEYGELGAEYELAEFSSSLTIDLNRVNPAGSGQTLSVGLNAVVAKEISIQEINIQSLIGRIR